VTNEQWTPTTSAPWLCFQFPASVQAANALVFTRPRHVIAARRLPEVLPALRAVQDAVNGGAYAAGYVGYEAAPAFDDALHVGEGDTEDFASDLPLLWFGIYDQPAPVVLPSIMGKAQVSDWQPLTSPAAYAHDIAAIHEAIASGETYQVNHTLRLRARVEGDTWTLYQRLRAAQQPAYAACLDLGRYRILSASPELFFQRQGDCITTRPMKGTAPRARRWEEDRRLAEELARSEKNRAENIMIVDLLRNDLGRVAVPGTVRVTRLFDVERYPTVWQMTSTIEAQVPAQIGLADLFTALFPCGSVTGAPKSTAMRKIARLETTPRRVYCGAIGYVSPHNKEAVFNVAIRTLLLDTQSGIAEYGVGGGITWDSRAGDEYAEALTKAKILNHNTPPAEPFTGSSEPFSGPSFELFESLRLEQGRYWLLDHHLERLESSARHFGFSFALADVQACLDQEAQAAGEGAWKVRCLLDAQGNVRAEREVLAADGKFPLPVALAEQPIPRSEPFLYHKTTRREMYESRLNAARRQYPNLYDALLWNEQGELTEFTRGNLVADVQGRLLTPAHDSGLLAGTLRAHLLAHGDIHERVLTRADLADARGMWLINSVRGWLPIRLLNNPYAVKRTDSF
jgi:para-aminobenzoate synthetase/4-amino-4-deoxychorismate lyase